MAAIFLIGLALLLLMGTNRSLFLYINSITAHSSPLIWANLTFLGDTLTVSVLMILFIRKRPDLVWCRNNCHSYSNSDS